MPVARLNCFCYLPLLLLLGLFPASLDAHPPEGVPPHALGGIFPRISADGESFLFHTTVRSG